MKNGSSVVISIYHNFLNSRYDVSGHMKYVKTKSYLFSPYGRTYYSFIDRYLI